MAAAKKKPAAAQAAESEPDQGLVASQAIFVTPMAETSSPAREDVLAAASAVGEIQQSFRNALEEGVVESRAAFAKARTAADETASAFEVSFVAARDGALAINARVFAALRANADANFDFWKAMFAAKSLSDVITLQTEFARKQVETMTGQTKDLGEVTKKAMADAVEPITQQVAKSLRIAV